MAGKRARPESPHRLRHIEHQAGMPQHLGAFEPGDVVVRHGTPVMVLKDWVGQPPEGEAGSMLVPVVNLTNGSAWNASASDQVAPAFEARLMYQVRRAF